MEGRRRLLDAKQACGSELYGLMNTVLTLNEQIPDMRAEVAFDRDERRLGYGDLRDVAEFGAYEKFFRGPIGCEWAFRHGYVLHLIENSNARIRFYAQTLAIMGSILDRMP